MLHYLFQALCKHTQSQTLSCNVGRVGLSLSLLIQNSGSVWADISRVRRSWGGGGGSAGFRAVGGGRGGGGSAGFRAVGGGGGSAAFRAVGGGGFGCLQGCWGGGSAGFRAVGGGGFGWLQGCWGGGGGSAGFRAVGGGGGSAGFRAVGGGCWMDGGRCFPPEVISHWGGGRAVFADKQS